MTLLVGSHFHPPAKTLLEHLPVGTVLELRAEPDNPYDEHAIAVMLRSSSIPESQHEVLAEALPSQGSSLEEILAAPEWFIGHIAASEGKPLIKAAESGAENLVGTREIERFLPCNATLGFLPDGKPTLTVGQQPREAPEAPAEAPDAE